MEEFPEDDVEEGVGVDRSVDDAGMTEAADDDEDDPGAPPPPSVIIELGPPIGGGGRPPGRPDIPPPTVGLGESMVCMG